MELKPGNVYRLISNEPHYVYPAGEAILYEKRIKIKKGFLVTFICKESNRYCFYSKYGLIKSFYYNDNFEKLFECVLD